MTRFVIEASVGIELTRLQGAALVTTDPELVAALEGVVELASVEAVEVA